MTKILISRDDLTRSINSSLSKKEIAREHGISLYYLNKLLASYKLKRNQSLVKEIRISRQQKTNLLRYGGKSPFSSKEIKVKARLSLIKTYGVPNPSQSKEASAKRIATNLLRYGYSNPLINKEVHSKSLATLWRIYGTANPNQLLTIKQKIIATNLKRRHVKFVTQDPIVKANGIITRLEKSGELEKNSTRK